MKFKSSGATQMKYTGTTVAKMNAEASSSAEVGLDRALRNAYTARNETTSSSALKIRNPLASNSRTNGAASAG